MEFFVIFLCKYLMPLIKQNTQYICNKPCYMHYYYISQEG